MSSSAEFLRRFRFRGVPGAPTAVPVDRASALASELRPVFERLEPARQRATAVVTRAQRAAERERADASAAAAAVLAEARARAERERSQASARAVARAEEQRDQLLAAALKRAEAIETAARSRLPGLVETVVEVVMRSDGGRPA